MAFLDAITLGIPHPWVDSPQTDRVADGFRQGRRRLAAAGVKLVDIDVPELEPPGMIEPSASFEIAEVHRSRWQEAPERYGPDTARRLATAFETTGSDYLEALRWRARCRHAADRALQQCDALLTPTVAALEKPIGVDTIPIRGEHVQHWGLLTTFTALVSHTSLPALALPQVVAGAPPPSLQLIGPPWSEHRLLEIGAALESAGIVGAEVPTGTVEAG
jgi:aspartyl-tRNA(Asn)/glutamyl-tRNA(Gln) amidotransferase subunit A